MAHQGLKLHTALKVTQTQKLSLEQQLSFQLLQMNQLDLEQYIAEQVNVNPFLQVEEPASPLTQPAPMRDFSRGSESEDDNWIERVAQPETGFYDRLIEQVEISHFPANLRKEILALIPYLDKHGMLPRECPIPDWTQERYEEAVLQFQKLDPPGLGARSVTESLLLQAAAYDLPELVDTLIEQHLDKVAAGDIDALRRATGADDEELREAIQLLRTLSPYPVNLDNETTSHFTRPDVVVEKRGDTYVVAEAMTIPLKPSINERYKELLKEPHLTDEEREQLRRQYNEAQNLLRFCDLRESTVVKVARILVREQQAFFHEGPSGLKPLGMKQVAEELGLHESTISRAVSGKTMLTDRGLIPFRNLFVQKVSENAEGDVVGAAVREAMLDLMRIEAKERRDKPYSDQEIVEILAARGIQVARRTVNKYRNILQIPSRSERRKRYRLESFTEGQ